MNSGFPRLWVIALGAMAGMLPLSAASAQLRIAQWNVTNYKDGREEAFQAAIYAEFQGRSMAPDVLICQEFISEQAAQNFLAILNTAPQSPGDWGAAEFINGPDTDSAFFFRTGRVEYLGVTVVSPGGISPHHPRNLQRYDLRPVGYASPGATLACYSSHMKAGNSGEDQARRLVEAKIIREDAAGLPSGWHFLLAADLNIPTSAQAAYQALIGPEPSEAGRLFDPIKSPGNWQKNPSHRFIHTQDPVGSPGMDDRYDQVLLSAALIAADGFSYIGNPSLPYSAFTWDDPNHSYRAWGNDGTSFAMPLTVFGNSMVGPLIAQALKDSVGAATGGHLPVFLDLRIPAHIWSTETIDFGTVPQGAPAQAALDVLNAGDVELWGVEGIADLAYSLGASRGFAAPPGPFIAAAGGPAARHAIQMDTGELGPKRGTLVIISNAPDEPVRIVSLAGHIVCYADCDGSGSLNIDDFLCFQLGFALAQPYADCDQNGAFTIDDFLCFQLAFALGC